MKKIHILFPVFSAIVLLFAVQPVQAQSSKLRKQLIGEWRNLTMHLDIVKAADTAKNKVFYCDESNWQSMLHIKPIHTFFNDDNTFHSDYYTLKDSLFRRAAGKWELKGSRLTFYYATPKADTAYFTLSIKKDVATFKGMVDWSGDGKKDDTYIGTQRKQPAQKKEN